MTHPDMALLDVEGSVKTLVADLPLDEQPAHLSADTCGPPGSPVSSRGALIRSDSSGPAGSLTGSLGQGHSDKAAIEVTPIAPLAFPSQLLLHPQPQTVLLPSPPESPPKAPPVFHTSRTGRAPHAFPPGYQIRGPRRRAPLRAWRLAPSEFTPALVGKVLQVHSVADTQWYPVVVTTVGLAEGTATLLLESGDTELGVPLKELIEAKNVSWLLAEDAPPMPKHPRRTMSVPNRSHPPGVLGTAKRQRSMGEPKDSATDLSGMLPPLKMRKDSTETHSEDFGAPDCRLLYDASPRCPAQVRTPTVSSPPRQLSVVGTEFGPVKPSLAPLGAPAVAPGLRAVPELLRRGREAMGQEILLNASGKWFQGRVVSANASTESIQVLIAGRMLLLQAKDEGVKYRLMVP